MGVLLSRLRLRASLSAKAAADAIGVVVQTVYYWESGEKEPDKDSLRKLCDVYGATEAERAELARLRAFGPTTADTAPAA